MSLAAGQLLAAERSGKPLSPKTLDYYEQQLKGFDEQRGRMLELIAQWWTMLEERPQ